MEFSVLGPVEVVDGDRQLALGGPKPRALLAHLILRAGHATTRHELIDELWGEEPPRSARDSLNVHAGLLRRALGPRLRTVATGYLLQASPEEVDASRFESQVEAARARPRSPAESSALLGAALGLWRGSPFGGIPVGPIATAAAARLDELRLGALEERVEADLALGRHADLVAELKGHLGSSPGRERLAGQLMLALHRCGRSADALSVFAATSRFLDHQLGVDPGDALTELSKAIHRDDPTLAAPGPALLPAPLTKFIGRGEELVRGEELLKSARLLTLTGVGGCGKTRLALELARVAAPAHPGGVEFVDLAALAPGSSVARQVAAALDVHERRGSSLVSQLANRLRHRRALLVLDNCEHLIQGCVELCSQLLEAAPGLRILATSREALGMPGEVVFTVPGLGVPAVNDPAPEVLETDAIRLLVERASAARPGFALVGADQRLAAALCRRLDGLPLAIELAAAQLRNLSLQEVADRVDARLDSLSGSRSIDARHRTMRASIEWSHEMLEETERIVLRRLSLFAGGFSSKAAQAVAANWAPLADIDIAGICNRLVGKSVLAAEPGPEYTGYRILEIVRQFASEKVEEAEETSEGRARHAQWYHDLVPDSRVWAGPDQPLWLDRLKREIENVHAALAWYLGDGWDPECALEMAGPMWWYWNTTGRGGEGRIWLSRVLAAATPQPTAARALAVRGAAALARSMGEFGEALRLGNESLAIARTLGEPRGVAAALNNLCITAMTSGNLEDARLHGEEGLEIIERLGDEQGIATSRNNLGLVARVSGDLDRAEELFTTALANYRLREDRRGIAAASSNLAIVARRRGDPVRAHALAVEALRLYTELAFCEGQLDCLEAVGALAAEAGDYESALRLLTMTARVRDELGSPLFVADEIAQVRDALAIARTGIDEPSMRRAMVQANDLTVDMAVAVYLALRPQFALAEIYTDGEN